MEVKYDRLVIYYFSGTGNTENAAYWICKVADELQIPSEMIDISRFQQVKLPEKAERLLIGFCAPTHGFNLPPVMLKFIWRFPKIPGTDVFLLNSRAGMKLRKFFTPGLSGAAQLWPALLLKIKGFRIRGMQPMDLPSNWISLHPGLRAKVVDSIYERCRKITRCFSKKILTCQSVYTALWSLPLDIAVLPVSLLYYMIGRFALAKTFVATRACTQCGLCEKKCPVDAIRIRKNSVHWSFRCESCMRCMNICPQQAIQTTHSYTLAIWYVAFSVLAPLIQRYLLNNPLIHISATMPETGVLIFLIESYIALVIIYISYELFLQIMRIKLFSTLIEWTSLTRFGFWRRYKKQKKHKGQ